MGNEQSHDDASTVSAAASPQMDGADNDDIQEAVPVGVDNDSNDDAVQRIRLDEVARRDDEKYPEQSGSNMGLDDDATVDDNEDHHVVLADAETTVEKDHAAAASNIDTATVVVPQISQTNAVHHAHTRLPPPPTAAPAKAQVAQNNGIASDVVDAKDALQVAAWPDAAVAGPPAFATGPAPPQPPANLPSNDDDNDGNGSSNNGTLSDVVDAKGALQVAASPNAAVAELPTSATGQAPPQPPVNLPKSNEDDNDGNGSAIASSQYYETMDSATVAAAAGDAVFANQKPCTSSEQDGGFVPAAAHTAADGTAKVVVAEEVSNADPTTGHQTELCSIPKPFTGGTASKGPPAPEDDSGPVRAATSQISASNASDDALVAAGAAAVALDSAMEKFGSDMVAATRSDTGPAAERLDKVDIVPSTLRDQRTAMNAQAGCERGLNITIGIDSTLTTGHATAVTSANGPQGLPLADSVGGNRPTVDVATADRTIADSMVDLNAPTHSTNEELDAGPSVAARTVVDRPKGDTDTTTPAIAREKNTGLVSVRPSDSIVGGTAHTGTTCADDTERNLSPDTVAMTGVEEVASCNQGATANATTTNVQVCDTSNDAVAANSTIDPKTALLNTTEQSAIEGIPNSQRRAETYGSSGDDVVPPAEVHASEYDSDRTVPTRAVAAHDVPGPSSKTLPKERVTGMATSKTLELFNRDVPNLIEGFSTTNRPEVEDAGSMSADDDNNTVSQASTSVDIATTDLRLGRNDERWLTVYEQVREYAQQNGGRMPPQKYVSPTTGDKLASWCNNQRCFYRNIMSDDKYQNMLLDEFRARKLMEIKAIPTNVSVEIVMKKKKTKLAALKMKRQIPSVPLPRTNEIPKEAPSTGDSHNSETGASDAPIALTTRRDVENAAKWLAIWEEVRVYKQEHSNRWPPKGYVSKSGGNLYSWLSNQKNYHRYIIQQRHDRYMPLNAERIEKLMKIEAIPTKPTVKKLMALKRSALEARNAAKGSHRSAPAISTTASSVETTSLAAHSSLRRALPSFGANGSDSVSVPTGVAREASSDKENGDPLQNQRENYTESLERRNLAQKEEAKLLAEIDRAIARAEERELLRDLDRDIARAEEKELLRDIELDITRAEKAALQKARKCTESITDGAGRPLIAHSPVLAQLGDRTRSSREENHDAAVRWDIQHSNSRLLNAVPTDPAVLSTDSHKDTLSRTDESDGHKRRTSALSNDQDSASLAFVVPMSASASKSTGNAENAGGACLNSSDLELSPRDPAAPVSELARDRSVGIKVAATKSSETDCISKSRAGNDARVQLSYDNNRRMYRPSVIIDGGEPDLLECWREVHGCWESAGDAVLTQLQAGRVDIESDCPRPVRIQKVVRRCLAVNETNWWNDDNMKLFRRELRSKCDIAPQINFAEVPRHPELVKIDCMVDRSAVKIAEKLINDYAKRQYCAEVFAATQDSKWARTIQLSTANGQKIDGRLVTVLEGKVHVGLVIQVIAGGQLESRLSPKERNCEFVVLSRVNNKIVKSIIDVRNQLDASSNGQSLMTLHFPTFVAPAKNVIEPDAPGAPKVAENSSIVERKERTSPAVGRKVQLDSCSVVRDSDIGTTLDSNESPRVRAANDVQDGLGVARGKGSVDCETGAAHSSVGSESTTLSSISKRGAEVLQNNFGFPDFKASEESNGTRSDDQKQSASGTELNNKDARSPNSYLDFRVKVSEAVEIEFNGCGIHKQHIFSRMWQTHKKTIGITCDNACRCVFLLPEMALDVVDTWLERKGKDPLDLQPGSAPVGFLTNFARTFLPKLQTRFPGETSGELLKRLCENWPAHTKQMRFGPTCTANCECFEGWDVVFPVGHVKSAVPNTHGKRKASTAHLSVPRKFRDSDDPYPSFPMPKKKRVSEGDVSLIQSASSLKASTTAAEIVRRHSTSENSGHPTKPFARRREPTERQKSFREGQGRYKGVDGARSHSSTDQGSERIDQGTGRQNGKRQSASVQPHLDTGSKKKRRHEVSDEPKANATANENAQSTQQEEWVRFEAPILRRTSVWTPPSILTYVHHVAAARTVRFGDTAEVRMFIADEASNMFFVKTNLAPPLMVHRVSPTIVSRAIDPEKNLRDAVNSNLESCISALQGGILGGLEAKKVMKILPALRKGFDPKTKAEDPEMQVKDILLKVYINAQYVSAMARDLKRCSHFELALEYLTIPSSLDNVRVDKAVAQYPGKAEPICIPTLRRDGPGLFAAVGSDNAFDMYHVPYEDRSITYEISGSASSARGVATVSLKDIHERCYHFRGWHDMSVSIKGIDNGRLNFRARSIQVDQKYVDNKRSSAIEKLKTVLSWCKQLPNSIDAIPGMSAKFSIDVPVAGHMTLLHTAVNLLCPECVQDLVQSGADPDFKPPGGPSPRTLALNLADSVKNSASSNDSPEGDDPDHRVVYDVATKGNADRKLAKLQQIIAHLRSRSDRQIA